MSLRHQKDRKKIMTDMYTACRTLASRLSGAVLCLTAVPALVPVVAALSAVSAATSSALAQSAQPELRYATVTGDNVYFRSGPADTYYPMGRLQRGDMLVILDERFGWTRVQMRGPAFREFFGHIVSPRNEGARFERISANRGRTIGRVDLLAPNLNTNFRPEDSWKRLRLLDNNTELEIRDVSSNEQADVYRVVVPPETEGWINTAFITASTRQAFEQFVSRHTAETVRQGVEERTTAPPLARDATRIEPAPETESAASSRAPEGDRPASPLSPVSRDVAIPDAPAETIAARETERAAPAADEAQRAEPAKPAKSEETERPRTAMEELETLEAAFTKIQALPIEDAEVVPLRDLYQSLVRTFPESEAVVRFAERRIEQLTLWNRLQERRQRLAALERRLDLNTEDVQAARTAMETAGPYSAVGRLVSSTIFEGERLPRLFRLQDPTSGRTLAYIRPDDAFDLSAMLGQVIGVSGDRSFDPGLRIDLIRPRRIDLLVPGR